MKQTILALSCAVLILTGCQDEKPTRDTPVAPPQDIEAAPEAPAIAVDSAHNARNALDWNGTYTGRLPCADCAGINVSLTLNQDGTYLLLQSYIDQESGATTSEGHFQWNEAGSIVTLREENKPNQYFVGENILMKLDINGQRITGELATSYHLTKQ
ncbi:copper resistance protein NlpE [Vibrio sp. CAU 1672]|uniref:copper resistance protein NlpE n=1 Tax=Vibrio sp. CAU 1672 TaxID=3032594 RepID=UPI0023DCACC3|nr:copper resistance protein NlpE [Vibrio sp. CAU 1672]MDF2152978.1 copper resistance protein NlpE [Vibrio sp. CAU 1672]